LHQTHQDLWRPVVDVPVDGGLAMTQFAGGIGYGIKNYTIEKNNINFLIRVNLAKGSY
jgi:hypothetical protein